MGFFIFALIRMLKLQESRRLLSLLEIKNVMWYNYRATPKAKLCRKRGTEYGL